MMRLPLVLFLLTVSSCGDRSAVPDAPGARPAPTRAYKVPAPPMTKERESVDDRLDRAKEMIERGQALSRKRDEDLRQ